MTPRYCDNPGLIRMNVKTVSVTKSTLTLSEKVTISESDSPVETRSARVNNPPDMGCVRERRDEAVILTSHWSVPATVVRENQRTERAVNSDSDMQWQ